MPRCLDAFPMENLTLVVRTRCGHVYRSLLVSSLFMEESRTKILKPHSRSLICVYPELGNSVPRSASVDSAEANPSVLTVTLVFKA